jgi:uncharacterized repeat protein (TIGR01451 family)
VGLAYATGTAQENPFNPDRLAFEEPAPKRGVSYFSKSGNTATQAVPTQQQPTRRTRRVLPSRYVQRSQPEAPSAPTRPNLKNYRRELFGQSETKEDVQQESAPPYGFGAGQPGDTGNGPQNAVPSVNVDAFGAGSREELRSARYNPFDNNSQRGAVRQVQGQELPPSQSSEADDAPPTPPLQTETSPSETQAPPHDPSISIIPGHRALAQKTKPSSEAPVGRQTPSISLEWVRHTDVNVGQECECHLIVKNTGKTIAKQIAVDAYFPKTVRLIGATPEAADKTDHLSWDFAQLEVGEERVIEIRMVPSQRGELATTAYVRFTGSAGGVFRVEEPLLDIELKGPTEVMVGEIASQTVTVSNPGSGVAKNVVVEATIPEGLEHPRGERLVMEIGALNPGETRMVRLALAAIDGGLQVLNVEARAEGALLQKISSEVTVVAPSIKLDITGPNLRYIGRTAQFQLTVTNDGPASSNNVRVLYRISDGFKFVRADKGGKYDSANSTAGWFIGRLEPGESTSMSVELLANQPGTFVQRAGAVSEHGARAEAEFETNVEGTASLVLEIIDLNDPVEVGAETAYEVRVRNEGTKAAQNVGISCELPPAVELIAAKGPADHISESGLVVFKSLDSLAPGKTAVYRIDVQGNVEGNHRFRARLASDSIQEPLIFEELTKFYGD